MVALEILVFVEKFPKIPETCRLAFARSLSVDEKARSKIEISPRGVILLLIVGYDTYTIVPVLL